MEEDWLRIGWHCTSCSAYQYWSRADFPMPKVEVEGCIPAALLVTQGKWPSHMTFVNVHELCYETVQVERGGRECVLARERQPCRYLLVGDVQEYSAC